MASSVLTKPATKVTSAAIRRAVASSTAIETGQSIEQLERKLQKGLPCRGQPVGLAARKTR